MRNLILAVLSLFVLVSCSSSKSDGEMHSDLNKIYGIANADSLQDYTAVIYEHSQESIAKVSPSVVDACLIGPNGIDRNDLAALIELDRQQAVECWNLLLSYPRADRRFFRTNTIENSTLHNFILHERDYKVLFTR